MLTTPQLCNRLRALPPYSSEYWNLAAKHLRSRCRAAIICSLLYLTVSLLCLAVFLHGTKHWGLNAVLFLGILGAGFMAWVDGPSALSSYRLLKEGQFEKDSTLRLIRLRLVAIEFAEEPVRNVILEASNTLIDGDA